MATVVTTTVSPRASEAHCGCCGSLDVVAVCHHCASALCRNDVHAAATAGRETTEFASLGLAARQTQEMPAHCADCNHVVKPQTWHPYGVAAALLLVGLWGLARLPAVTSGGWHARAWSGVTALGGVIVGGLGIWTNRRRRADELAHRPPLPLLPHFEGLYASERLTYALELDGEGRFHCHEPETGGELQAQALLRLADRERLTAYRHRFSLSEEQPVQLHAGFLLPSGRVGIEFADRRHGHRPSAALPITAGLEEVRFLSGRGSGTDEWLWRRPYRLRVSESGAAMPVWVVPAFEPGAGRRTLGVEVQWSDILGEAGVEEIESLELYLPHDWTTADARTAGARFDEAPPATDGAIRRVTWRRRPLERSERDARRAQFVLSFREDLDASAVLCGRVEIRVNHSLSGVDGLKCFSALGWPQLDAPGARIVTRIAVDFALAMRCVCHSEVCIVPKDREEGQQARPETRKFDGVAPDPATVMALLEALSHAEGCYVRTVIENAPTERAGTVKRLWDISGRTYHYHSGVFPVDWRLTLRGEEEAARERRVMTAALTAQSTTSSPEMTAEIEVVWDRLDAVVSSALEDLTARGAPTPPREAPEAAEHANG